ncbi:MAG: hypothetical protein PHQ96_08400, partial [Candidatus Omnitrophica bacterium]|nr:hypothetical protein [Candidatus Omnitrophota bacterium]
KINLGDIKPDNIYLSDDETMVFEHSYRMFEVYSRVDGRHLYTLEGATGFFRNYDKWGIAFEAYLDRLIPEKIRNSDYCLGVKSLGCSSGEELYTIAAVIKRKLKQYGEDVDIPEVYARWRILIQGYDINPAVSQVVRNATYRLLFAYTDFSRVSYDASDIMENASMEDAVADIMEGRISRERIKEPIRKWVNAHVMDLSLVSNLEKLSDGAANIIICRVARSYITFKGMLSDVSVQFDSFLNNGEWNDPRYESAIIVDDTVKFRPPFCACGVSLFDVTGYEKEQMISEKAWREFVNTSRLSVETINALQNLGFAVLIGSRYDLEASAQNKLQEFFGPYSSQVYGNIVIGGLPAALENLGQHGGNNGVLMLRRPMLISGDQHYSFEYILFDRGPGMVGLNQAISGDSVAILGRKHQAMGYMVKDADRILIKEFHAVSGISYEGQFWAKDEDGKVTVGVVPANLISGSGILIRFKKELPYFQPPVRTSTTDGKKEDSDQFTESNEMICAWGMDWLMVLFLPVLACAVFGNDGWRKGKGMSGEAEKDNKDSAASSPVEPVGSRISSQAISQRLIGEALQWIDTRFTDELFGHGEWVKTGMVEIFQAPQEENPQNKGFAAYLVPQGEPGFRYECFIAANEIKAWFTARGIEPSLVRIQTPLWDDHFCVELPSGLVLSGTPELRIVTPATVISKSLCNAAQAQEKYEKFLSGNAYYPLTSYRPYGWVRLTKDSGILLKIGVDIRDKERISFDMRAAYVEGALVAEEMDIHLIVPSRSLFDLKEDVLQEGLDNFSVFLRTRLVFSDSPEHHISPDVLAKRQALNRQLQAQCNALYYIIANFNLISPYMTMNNFVTASDIGLKVKQWLKAQPYGGTRLEALVDELKARMTRLLLPQSIQDASLIVQTQKVIANCVVAAVHDYYQNYREGTPGGFASSPAGTEADLFEQKLIQRYVIPESVLLREKLPVWGQDISLTRMQPTLGEKMIEEIFYRAGSLFVVHSGLPLDMEERNWDTIKVIWTDFSEERRQTFLVSGLSIADLMNFGAAMSIFPQAYRPWSLGCLAALQILDLKEKRVFVAGSGSGVLGMAAVAYGAAKAYLIEKEKIFKSLVIGNIFRSGLLGWRKYGSTFCNLPGHDFTHLGCRVPAEVFVSNLPYFGLNVPGTKNKTDMLKAGIKAVDGLEYLIVSGGYLKYFASLYGLPKGQAQEAARRYFEKLGFEIADIIQIGLFSDWELAKAIEPKLTGEVQRDDFLHTTLICRRAGLVPCANLSTYQKSVSSPANKKQEPAQENQEIQGAEWSAFAKFSLAPGRDIVVIAPGTPDYSRIFAAGLDPIDIFEKLKAIKEYLFFIVIPQSPDEHQDYISLGLKPLVKPADIFAWLGTDMFYQLQLSPNEKAFTSFRIKFRKPFEITNVPFVPKIHVETVEFVRKGLTVTQTVYDTYRGNEGVDPISARFKELASRIATSRNTSGLNFAQQQREFIAELINHERYFDIVGLPLGLPDMQTKNEARRISGLPDTALSVTDVRQELAAPRKPTAQKALINDDKETKLYRGALFAEVEKMAPKIEAAVRTMKARFKTVEKYLPAQGASVLCGNIDKLTVAQVHEELALRRVDLGHVAVRISKMIEIYLRETIEKIDEEICVPLSDEEMHRGVTELVREFPELGLPDKLQGVLRSPDAGRSWSLARVAQTLSEIRQAAGIARKEFSGFPWFSRVVFFADKDVNVSCLPLVSMKSKEAALCLNIESITFSTADVGDVERFTILNVYGEMLTIFDDVLQQRAREATGSVAYEKTLDELINLIFGQDDLYCQSFFEIICSKVTVHAAEGLKNHRWLGEIHLYNQLTTIELLSGWELYVTSILGHSIMIMVGARLSYVASRRLWPKAYKYLSVLADDLSQKIEENLRNQLPATEMYRRAQKIYATPQERIRAGELVNLEPYVQRFKQELGGQTLWDMFAHLIALACVYVIVDVNKDSGRIMKAQNIKTRLFKEIAEKRQMFRPMEFSVFQPEIFKIDWELLFEELVEEYRDILDILEIRDNPPAVQSDLPQDDAATSSPADFQDLRPGHRDRDALASLFFELWRMNMMFTAYQEILIPYGQKTRERVRRVVVQLKQETTNQALFKEAMDLVSLMPNPHHIDIEKGGKDNWINWFKVGFDCETRVSWFGGLGFVVPSHRGIGRGCADPCLHCGRNNRLFLSRNDPLPVVLSEKGTSALWDRNEPFNWCDPFFGVYLDGIVEYGMQHFPEHLNRIQIRGWYREDIRAQTAGEFIGQIAFPAGGRFDLSFHLAWRAPNIIKAIRKARGRDVDDEVIEDYAQRYANVIQTLGPALKDLRVFFTRKYPSYDNATRRAFERTLEICNFPHQGVIELLPESIYGVPPYRIRSGKFDFGVAWELISRNGKGGEFLDRLEDACLGSSIRKWLTKA